MAVAFFPSGASMEPVTAQIAPQIADLKAGTALPLGAACYIDGAGLAQLCDATAADVKGAFVGMPGRAVQAGEPVTLLGPGTRLLYDATGLQGLVAGMQLFLNTTPGGLQDTAATGDTTGVAVALNIYDIVISKFKLIGG